MRWNLNFLRRVYTWRDSKQEKWEKLLPQELERNFPGNYSTPSIRPLWWWIPQGVFSRVLALTGLPLALSSLGAPQRSRSGRAAGGSWVGGHSSCHWNVAPGWAVKTKLKPHAGHQCFKALYLLNDALKAWEILPCFYFMTTDFPELWMQFPNLFLHLLCCFPQMNNFSCPNYINNLSYTNTHNY